MVSQFLQDWKNDVLVRELSSGKADLSSDCFLLHCQRGFCGTLDCCYFGSLLRLRSSALTVGCGFCCMPFEGWHWEHQSCLIVLVLGEVINTVDRAHVLVVNHGILGYCDIGY